MLLTGETQSDSFEAFWACLSQFVSRNSILQLSVGRRKYACWSQCLAWSTLKVYLWLFNNILPHHTVICSFVQNNKSERWMIMDLCWSNCEHIQCHNCLYIFCKAQIVFQENEQMWSSSSGYLPPVSHIFFQFAKFLILKFCTKCLMQERASSSLTSKVRMS